MSAKQEGATSAHKWELKARFRRHAFGWRSQPAITRIKEAIAEIRRVAKREPVLAAEGAVAFLERVSPALEHVDSSSGAVGSAVNHAIAELASIIARAPADTKTRSAWLERLWDAYQDDDIPYIELLGDHRGELCSSKDVASAWADRLAETVRMAWSPDPERRGYFKGTTSCLSALVAAERYEDVLALLDHAPYKTRHYRQYGVQALAAQGKKALAGRTPCDPRTLTRAARDYAEKQPAFAVGAGVLAFHWLVQGYGYEITSADVWDAYRSTIAAAERLGTTVETKERIRALVASEGKGDRFVTKVLGRELEL